jgi:hypothetical protein
MRKPLGRDFDVKTAGPGMRDAIFMDQFGRTKEHRTPSTGEGSSGKLLKESSRQHKAKRGQFVSVRVEAEPRGVARIGQGQIPELLDSAHASLNSRKELVVFHFLALSGDGTNWQNRVKLKWPNGDIPT